MNMIMYLLLLSVFISCYLIFYAFLGVYYRNKRVISIRLDKISKEDEKSMESELNQPLFVRVVRPILDDITRVVLKVTPKEIVSVFEKKGYYGG